MPPSAVAQGHANDAGAPPVGSFPLHPGVATIAVEECRGWEAGDRLVIRGSGDESVNEGAPTRLITSVAHNGDGRACTISLNGTVTVYGTHPASEVMNLERSIRFSGDWHPRTTTDGHACAARGCTARNASADEILIDPAVCAQPTFGATPD